MKIIPVIDLKNHIVVHAKQGDRNNYQAINSKLCKSADVFEVIKAFLALADFDSFYIADLNAITQQGNHDDLIAKLLKAFPKVSFWVDKGYQQARQLPDATNYLPVLGSESYNEATAAELKDFKNQFVLSLDYSSNGEKLGPDSLFSNTHFWPENIIIMTLAQVGSGNGPDLAKLDAFCRTYPNKSFIAAGGVRNTEDLLALQQLGVKQALVASALHAGIIGRADLANFGQKNTPAS